MRLLPHIIKARTSIEDLEEYFRFFEDIAEEDQRYSVLSFAKTISPEICDEVNLNPRISSGALECLRMKSYNKESKIEIQDLDEYIANKA